MKLTATQLKKIIIQELSQVEKVEETASNLFRSTLGNIKESEEALDNLINWIDAADYSTDLEPRLSEEEWNAAQEIAVIAENVIRQVQFLKRVPKTQIINDDND